MSYLLDNALDAERLDACLRNDEAMRTTTHAYLQEPSTLAKLPASRHPAVAIERYRRPLWKRALAAFWRWC